MDRFYILEQVQKWSEVTRSVGISTYDQICDWKTEYKHLAFWTKRN